MKKMLLGLIMLLCLAGCSNYLEHTITYTKISYSELEEKINNKESFILVIGSSTCHNCVTYKETIETTKNKEKITMYYIYLDDLSETDYAKIYSKYAITSTPTTIFFKNGVEESTYNRILGRVNSSELKKQLQKNGYIGE